MHSNMSNKNLDEYQRRLRGMVYTFFDKNAKDAAADLKGIENETLLNQ